MPFFNKDLSKAIMTRTKLRNIFLQNKSEENKIRYTKQGNFCVSLLRKTNKASQSSDIPTKIVIENVDIFGDFICTSYNNTVKSSQFYQNLKLADITPAYKKGKKDMKENYRPVSILPNLSKIFEKLMFKEMSQFFDKIFSKYQCGFRKGFSTQQCLLAMLEKWKRSIDNGKSFGALLTYLSKAFDCLDHELLIAKLNAHGFHLSALKLIHDYLSNRKQRTKINSTYSKWHEILFGVPQGSILGPLLFNIYLIDLFFVIEDTDITLTTIHLILLTIR